MRTVEPVALLCLALLASCDGEAGAAAQARAKNEFVEAMGIAESPLVCQQRNSFHCLRCNAIVGDKPAVFTCCEDQCWWLCR